MGAEQVLKGVHESNSMTMTVKGRSNSEDGWVRTARGVHCQRTPNSLERRVVELVLVAAGDRRPHALVGPQAGESVAQEGKQHLILIKAAAAGQDRVGVNLQEKINEDTKQTGKLWQNTPSRVCLHP